MKEIRKYLYALLESDTTIRTYTGHSASDPRVYLIWPPENIKLTVSTPAKIAVNYSELGSIPSGELVEGAQYPDGFFMVDVFANTPDLRDDIVERIETLFKRSNYSDLEFSTTTFRIMRIERESKENSVELHPGTQKIDSFRTHLRFYLHKIYRK